MIRRYPRSFYTAYALIVILLLWYLAAAIAKLPFLPSPVVVLANVWQIFADTLWLHALASLYRIALGIGISLILGLLIGLSMGYYDRWDKLFSPIVYLLYPIPKIALLPLVMLLCGMGEVAKVTMIVLIVVFQVIVASRDGARAIRPETFYGLRVLGASDAAIFRRVVFPATLPAIFSSLRVSMGTALSVLFFTETFGTRYGMGYFIMNSWTRVNYVDMFSGIVVLAVLGYFLFFLVDACARRCCRWQQG